MERKRPSNIIAGTRVYLRALAESKERLHHYQAQTAAPREALEAFDITDDEPPTLPDEPPPGWAEP